MKIEMADPKALEPSAYNPRKISAEEMAKLRRSIREFGIVQPIIVQMPGNRIIAGHQRRDAAIAEGLPKIPIHRLRISDAKAKAMNLALNRISGEWDDEKLAALLRELQDVDWEKEIGVNSQDAGLALTGFDSDEIERLLKSTDENLGIEGDEEHAAELEDAADALQKKWWVEPGQAFALESANSSRLIVCSDCLIEMQNLKASMVFTDPPWNVAIGGDANPRHRQRKLLQGDSMKPETWAAAFERFAALLQIGCQGDLYLTMGCEQWPVIDAALRKAGFHWSGTIIWAKDIFVLGRSHYHRKFEPIWYGWPENRKSSFCGGRDQDDLWEIARPRCSPEHPTMKPVELAARAILNSSRKGDSVADPYLGSGTTLIAADELGRRGIGIEIEPRFVAVALQRTADRGAKIVKTFAPSDAMRAREFLFGAPAAAPGGRP